MRLTISSSRSGTLVGQATRGEPAEPNLRAAAPRRLRRISRPSISSQCGLESFGWGPASEIYSLCFLKKVHGKGFSRRTAANFNLLLRVKAPLCKDFSV